MNRALIAIAITTLALVLVPAARAGTYEVHGCDTGSVSGWAPYAAGPYNGYGDGCAAGGRLTLHNEIGSPGEASWRFTSPPHTEVAGFQIARSYRLAPNRPWGTMVYRLETYGNGSRYRNYLPNFGGGEVAHGMSWESAEGLTGQTMIVLSLDCGGGLSCNAPGGEAAIAATRVSLRDTTAPTIQSVTGGLAQDGPLAGRELLAYAAEDRGGGLWRAELRVDDARVAGGPVHGNDGYCALPFRHVVPCRTAASQTLALDTRSLSDGRHALELRVTDVAGNAATWRRTITVVNHADEPRSPAPPNRPEPRTAAPPARITAWLERGRRSTTATAPYGERVRIRGRITDAQGRALAATPLAITESLIDGHGRALKAARDEVVAAGDGVVAAGDGVVSRRDGVVAARSGLVRGGRWPAVTGVRSRPNGRFTAFTRVGPSRRIAIAGPGGARAPRLTLRVRAAVSLARAAGGLVRGRVRGTHVPRGTLVELQTRARGRWATRLVVRTRGEGRFEGRLAGAPVRAVVPRQPRLPYAAGRSRAR
jgi:hypothetical protein